MKNNCFILLFLCCGLVALAGNDNLPVGSRAAALGNAYAPLSDVWSAAHNQAGLGFVRTGGAGIYYENRFLLKELSIKSAVLAIPVKAVTIGFALTNFGYALYKENKYSLSFAKAFSPSFSAAMALDYLTTRMPEGNGSFHTLVGELGIQAKLRKDLTIGAHLYNPTRSKPDKNSTEHLPTIMRLGMCYSFSSRVLLTAETEKDLAKKAVFKTGIEYQPVNGFYLRIGVSTNPVLSSGGFGFRIKNFRIDLSANYHQTLGVTPQLGITYLFNKNEKTVRDDQ